MSDQVLKQIRINTGVVKRIFKETIMYKKETEEIQTTIDKMEADGKDPYDIKKRKELLDESKMMIPDCEGRLKQAIEKLTNLLENNKESSEEELYVAAKTVLAEVVVWNLEKLN